MTNKQKTTIIISSIALLLIVVGVSYAYFSAQITGGETSTTLTTSAGTLNVVFDGGTNITASNVIPQDTAVATKTFTVTGTNTTNLTMPYSLSLVMDSNTLSTGALTYTLTSTNTSANGIVVPSISTQTSIATGSSTISLGSGYFAKGTDKVHTYVLNIFFPNTESDQNTDQGKSFTAHVKIDSAESDEISSKLSALVSSSGTINFNANTTSYNIEVASTVNSITLTPTLSNLNYSSVTVDGAAVTSGVSSGYITLTTGNKTIPVVVTDINNNTTTYYVNVFKKPETLLTNIQVKAGMSYLTPSPLFSSSYDYINYGYLTITQTSVTVTPSYSNSDLTVEIYYGGVLKGTPSSGTGVSVGTLVSGNNIIYIKVTSKTYPDYSTTYTLTVPKS